MRRLCLGLLFLASAALALEPSSAAAISAAAGSALTVTAQGSQAAPTAVPGASGQTSAAAAAPASTATAAVAQGSPAPAAAALSVTASTATASTATGSPTPAAQPVETEPPASAQPYAAAVPPPDIPHVLTDFRPSWGAALRLGAALPLGGQAQAGSVGVMGGAQAVYHATQDSAVDLMGLYLSMPTTGAGTLASPVSAGGLAVKLDYDVYSRDKLEVWLGLGVGYMAMNSTNHVPRVPVSEPVTYNLVPQTSYGVALLASAGAGYTFVAHWRLDLELLVLNLDSDGGASNDLLAALPDLQLEWTY